MKNKIIITVLISLLVLFLFVSCTDKKGLENKTPDEDNKDIKNLENSAWIVYWDIENIKEEIDDLKDSLNSIYYFAAYFDSDDNLYLPNEITIAFDDINKSFKDKEFKSYLTFVNDIKYEDGKSSLKDTELLYRLLDTEEARKNHINSIIKLAKDNGYNGIEIDYENIRKDMTLWEYFIMFCDSLYHRATEENLDLRVTLEASTPFDKLKFPEGPTYSVMCYNLYGSHSGPGPKANADFLNNTVKKMSYLPGKKEFALASGGFDWTGDKKATAITEKKAIELKDKYNANINRDLESKAVYFEYVDSNGVSHSVYYADSETLSYWISIINENHKYGIALWRLGENLTLGEVIY